MSYLHNIQKIFCITNDNQTIEILNKILPPEKFSIINLENHGQVLDDIRKNSPHIILLDFVNITSSLELLNKIRESSLNKNIPILLLLEEALNHEVWGYLSNLGIIDYVEKPIQEITLQARIQSNVALSKSHEKLNNQKLVLEKLNKQLIDSQRQIEAFFDSGTQAYFLIDLNYKVLRYNKIAQNYISDLLSQKIKFGEEIFSYLYALDVPSFLNFFQKALKRKTILEDRPVRQKYLGTIWYQIQIAPAYDLQGEVFGVSMSILDITQRKRAQEKIKKQNERLTTTNEKLADLIREKEGLIGVVAHDLKAPLNRLQGICEVLGDLGELNEAQQQYFGIAEETLKNGKALITDILDMHAIDNPETIRKIESFEVYPFVECLLKNYNMESQRKKIALHLQYVGEKNAKINSDKSYLRRIFDNLLSNAFKFSPLNSNIFIFVTIENNVFSFEIKDEGQGIGKEEQKKLFKKFQKLSAKPTAGESSSGLGLAITKSLVERLQGKIEVESELGIGTSFKVSINSSKIIAN